MKPSNRYLVLRHGESSANSKNLIVSLPENGIEHYGLSEKGAAAISLLAQTNHAIDEITKIFASDFKRTIETAYIIGNTHSLPITADPLLRERAFPALELTHDKNYSSAWEYDIRGKTMKGVEPVTSVASRMSEMITNCEKYLDKEVILLVSHGDPLQILLAVTAGLEPFQHRDISHLDKGELREITFHKDFFN